MLSTGRSADGMRWPDGAAQHGQRASAPEFLG